MLIHGDCLDVLPTLPNASVDMVFSDLPYGVTNNRWDSRIDLGALWKQLRRVGMHACAYVFTATQPFATTLICSQPKIFRYDLVWHKSVPVGWLNAKVCPLRSHEHVLLFAAKKTIYNPQMVTGRNYAARDAGAALNYGKKKSVGYKGGTQRYPRSVVYFDQCRAQGRRKTIHPTQKPVSLLEWLIRTYTNEGDTVLDPTCGSGTTAIAAMNTGRKWVCIEKDADYHAVAAKRIDEHQAAPQQGELAV